MEAYDQGDLIVGRSSLNKLIGKPALLKHESSDQWPIQDQFVGIEIELENLSYAQQRLHEQEGMPYWEAHGDGSLRNGIEYVLRDPLLGSQLSNAISYFFQRFTEYADGPRTSIHVHLNMRQDEDTFEGLKNLLVLYYMYEDAFFKLADVNRKWCAYCNPFEDNPPDILTAVLRLDPEKAQKELFGHLNVSAAINTNRYYGLNINALQRFGTIEFRHFPLVREEVRLVEWIKLTMELKLAGRKLAEEGKQVSDLITCEQDMPKLREYFPNFWDILTKYVDNKTAFIRMSNVLGLTLPTERATGRGLGTNKAWEKYASEQKKRGREVVEKAAKKRKLVADIEPVQPLTWTANTTWMEPQVVTEADTAALNAAVERIRLAEQRRRVRQTDLDL